MAISNSYVKLPEGRWGYKPTFTSAWGAPSCMANPSNPPNSMEVYSWEDHPAGGRLWWRVMACRSHMQPMVLIYAQLHDWVMYLSTFYKIRWKTFQDSNFGNIGHVSK